MSDGAIVQALLSMGPGGLMSGILLLLWKQDRADRAAERAERLQIDRNKVESEKQLAVALTQLAMKITGKPIDGDQA